MGMVCISCKLEHDFKFCPNCGEKSATKKITFSSTVEDTFTTVYSMDRGFLYNLKALFSQPQKITNEYIKGKRNGIFNPISFLVFSVTLYLLLATFLHVPSENIEPKKALEPGLRKISYEVGYFLRAYIKYFWVLSIIPLGLSLKVVFKKYDFFENLAVGSFIVGQATLVAMLSHLIFRWPLIFDPFLYLAILWLIYRIFKNKNSKLESFFLSFAALCLFLLLLIVVVVIVGFLKA